MCCQNFLDAIISRKNYNEQRASEKNELRDKKCKKFERFSALLPKIFTIDKIEV